MGVNHNLVHVFRQDGLSEQQAYGEVGVLMRKRYCEWYLALSEIPVSGEKIDAQVMLYVQGCADAILGNPNWEYGPQLSDVFTSFHLISFDFLVSFVSSRLSSAFSVPFVLSLLISSRLLAGICDQCR